MDQYKPKLLKFDDYLSFFRDRHADKLTHRKLSQILSMHGLVKLNRHSKEKVMNAVSSLDLLMPTRSTTNTSTYSTMSPLSLVEVKLDIQEIGWEECPIGSVTTFEPTGYSATSDSSSSLSGVVNESMGVCTEKKKKEKEKIHRDDAGVVGEPLLVKRTVCVPADKEEHDVYSWRVNGRKKKEDVVYRSYYRCRAKMCPVRKAVALDPNDSSMCIVTYTGEHNHSVP